MSITAILPLVEIGARLIDKVLPDPAAKAQAQLDLMKLAQSGELAQLDADLKLALGQLEVNKAEAESGSLFVGGWRPAVGWICASGLLYQLMLAPLFGWVAMNAWQWLPPPKLEMDTLLTLLFGMLGLGAYRTVEKVRGVAKH